MAVDYAALARQHGGTVVDEESDGMLTSGNIDLTNRPRVKNRDGSISTVRSISVNMDGKEYLIPTVTDDGRVVSDDEAVKLFKKTGKHLGVFDSSEHATAYAEGLHSDQSKATGKGVDYAALARQHGGSVLEQAPEEAFPTPGQTARTFAGGAVRALPGMALGAIEGATAPIMAIPNEVKALVTGGPSPTMQALRESAGHVRAALAPGDTGPGRRIAEAVSAIPGAAPIVKGAETVLTPAYKSGLLDADLAMLGLEPGSGVGTVTPGEMKTAAETGGAATAGLAVPELARGGVAVARGVAKVSPGVGKVLQFSREHAPAIAKATVQGVTGHPVAAARTIIGIAAKHATLEKLSTIKQDAILTSVAAGDVEGAASALASGIEKSPAAAKAMAEALKAEAARIGASEASASTVPALEPVSPGLPDPPMRDSTPNAVAIRAANRRARQQGALARSQARAESTSSVVATPVVEQAVATLENRARMPEKGNVTMPSVSTRPKGSGPIQRPLTPKQREMRMNQLKAAEDAGMDIWEAFGVQKEN